MPFRRTYQLSLVAGGIAFAPICFFPEYISLMFGASGIHEVNPEQSAVRVREAALKNYQICSFLLFGLVFLYSERRLQRLEKISLGDGVESSRTELEIAAIDLYRDGVLVEKQGGIIIRGNSSFEKIFGIEAGKASGRSVKSIIGRMVRAAEDGKVMGRFLTESIEKGKTDLGEIVIPDPEMKVVQVTRNPIGVPNGGESGWVWIFHDVSINRELENEVRQAQKMEVVGQLAMGVAHDFNNLLTGINGNLAILEMELETKKVDLPERKNLRFAIQAGARAGELVKQLLGFSRRDRNRSHSYHAGVVINEVIGILSASVDPSTVLKAEVADNLWSAKGDANMLSQVLVNLMTNAVDALRGGGEVQILARNLEISESKIGPKAGDFVQISVKDNGVGMSHEVIDKIYKPFFTTKGAGKGTGLGLSTSLRIVERMGGWISVESREGVGSQFDIFLPRGLSFVQEEKSCAPFRLDEVAKSNPPKETILIVDDEEMVRMVAVTLLKRIGYRILVAGDGEEALKIYAEQAEEIDLVMLDLTMPKLSGRDTFARLRREFDHVPVLICSGYLVDLTAFKEEVGCCPEGFIQKPYRIEAMVMSIRDTIDGKIVAA